MSPVEIVTSAIREEQVGMFEVCPWSACPYGVVSLLDMLRLHADLFVKAFWSISEIEGKWHRTEGAIPVPEALAAVLVPLEIQCHLHGLTLTAQKCARVKEECHAKGMSYRDGVLALKEVRERLEDELHSRLFLQISQDVSDFYSDPTKGWKTVISRFPKTKKDVEDSAKCFAFEMYAASVFHILLVAEFGVIEVAKLLGVEGDRPGWGALERLQRITKKSYSDRSALERQHSNLLDNVLPLAVAMKDTWRHKISHVDNKLTWLDTDFSKRTADEIITSTRGFMRKLATELPAETP